MVTFKEKAGQGIGSLLITGFEVSRAESVLGKIWASIRKRGCERYKVDVVGLFNCSSSENVTTASCSFLPSYCFNEVEKIGKEAYATRFFKSFPLQMADFEDAIIAFLDDQENGLAAYEKLVAAGASSWEIRQLLNRFLLSINARTRGEQAKSEKRHALNLSTPKTRL